MTDKTQDLYRQALELHPRERAELAELLYASLPTDVEALWDSEIKGRIDEVDSGAVKLVPFEEAFKQITTPRTKPGS
jgi:putative addiction module component (TIGR02574 family)